MFKRIAIIGMLLVAVSMIGLPVAEAKFITTSGRAVMGYFQSDKNGLYDTTTFRIPDLKLVSTFDLPADIKALFRFTLNNNTFNGATIDYAYLDVPLEFMGIEAFKARLGQFKHPLGVETYIDNSVEQNLANNSVGIINGTDRGIMLMGKADMSDYGLTYELAVTEGTDNNATANPDVKSDKALTFRVGTKLTDALKVWGIWHNSGDLGNSNSAGKVAGENSATRAGATKNWEREHWLLHAEYSFENALLRGYFGEFKDDTESIGGVKGKREGKVWMAEIRYDLTSKVYVSGMFSKLDMDGSNLINANGGIGAVNGAGGREFVNEFKRTEVGIGYRLGEWVTLKYAWMNNKRDYSSAQKAAGVTDPDDDVQSAFVAVKF